MKSILLVASVVLLFSSNWAQAGAENCFDRSVSQKSDSPVDLFEQTPFWDATPKRFCLESASIQEVSGFFELSYVVAAETYEWPYQIVFPAAVARIPVKDASFRPFTIYMYKDCDSTCLNRYELKITARLNALDPTDVGAMNLSGVARWTRKHSPSSVASWIVDFTPIQQP